MSFIRHLLNIYNMQFCEGFHQYEKNAEAHIV